MKKILACLIMIFALQTVVFADAETDMHQHYIKKIQAQHVQYNTFNFFGAISNGNTQLVDMFLKAGMSPDSKFMGVPAINMAISSNQNDVVEQLLKAGVDPNKERSGCSPLLLAIRCKDAKIVQTLILYGADVNRDICSLTPLEYAVQKKQTKIVEILISSGARTNNEVLLRALKSKDNYIKDAVLKSYKKQN